jgi:hypothetical protein
VIATAYDVVRIAGSALLIFGVTVAFWGAK